MVTENLKAQKTITAKCPPILLAKKQSMPGKVQPEERLVGHIANVVRCAEQILEELGEQSILAMGIPPHRWQEACKTLRLAAYLHDIGKANSHFQRMIAEHKASGNRQMIRHEILSGYLTWKVPALRQWLADIEGINLAIAVWAAIGHHLKACESEGGYFPIKSDERRTYANPPQVILHVQHSDFQIY